MISLIRMSSSLWLMVWLLLLTLSVPCTRGAATTNDDGNGSSADAGRRARAAATVAEILSVHNAARLAVGVPALAWSPGIAALAKDFARSRRGDCAPRRSPLFYFGENISVGKGRHWNAAALAAPWVADRRWYDHGSNTCAAPPGGAGCLRYTQVVWRNTTQVGCARIVCDSGDTLLVCDYFPPGNYGAGRPY